MCFYVQLYLGIHGDHLPYMKGAIFAYSLCGFSHVFLSMVMLFVLNTVLNSMWIIVRQFWLGNNKKRKLCVCVQYKYYFKSFLSADDLICRCRGLTVILTTSVIYSLSSHALCNKVPRIAWCWYKGLFLIIQGRRNTSHIMASISEFLIDFDGNLDNSIQKTHIVNIILPSYNIYGP